jgi:hypothetical protein
MCPRTGTVFVAAGRLYGEPNLGKCSIGCLSAFLTPT